MSFIQRVAWRNLKGTSGALDLPALAVLNGRNGTGKTTVLAAIEYALRGSACGLGPRITAATLGAPGQVLEASVIISRPEGDLLVTRRAVPTDTGRETQLLLSPSFGAGTIRARQQVIDEAVGTAAVGFDLGVFLDSGTTKRAELLGSIVAAGAPAFSFSTFRDAVRNRDPGAVDFVNEWSSLSAGWAPGRDTVANARSIIAGAADRMKECGVLIAERSSVAAAFTVEMSAASPQSVSALAERIRALSGEIAAARAKVDSAPGMADVVTDRVAKLERATEAMLAAQTKLAAAESSHAEISRAVEVAKAASNVEQPASIEQTRDALAKANTAFEAFRRTTQTLIDERDAVGTRLARARDVVSSEHWQSWELVGTNAQAIIDVLEPSVFVIPAIHDAAEAILRIASRYTADPDAKQVDALALEFSRLDARVSEARPTVELSGREVTRLEKVLRDEVKAHAAAVKAAGDAYCDALAKLHVSQRNLAECSRAADRASAEVDAARAALESAPSAVDVEAIRSVIAGKSAELAEVERQHVAACQSFEAEQRAKSAAAKRDEAEAKRAAYAAIKNACTSFLRDLIGRSVGPILDAANECLGNGAWRIQLCADVGALDFEMTKKGTPVPFGALSRGELCRAASALARGIVIHQSIPCPILLVQAAEIDERSLAYFLEGLSASHVDGSVIVEYPHDFRNSEWENGFEVIAFPLPTSST